MLEFDENCNAQESLILARSGKLEVKLFHVPLSSEVRVSSHCRPITVQGICTAHLAVMMQIERNPHESQILAIKLRTYILIGFSNSILILKIKLSESEDQCRPKIEN